MRKRTPFPAYWVIPHLLMAGAWPGSLEGDDGRPRLRWLLGRGIRRFVDLTEEGEPGWWGGPLPSYRRDLVDEAGALGVAVEHRRYPIRDRGVPHVQTMATILRYVQASVGGRQSVYVHCLGGLGRTGTVVACYLLGQVSGSGRLSADGALLRLRQLREAQRVPRALDSPQTSVQFDFVRDWEGAGHA